MSKIVSVLPLILFTLNGWVMLLRQPEHFFSSTIASEFHLSQSSPWYLLLSPFLSPTLLGALLISIGLWISTRYFLLQMPGSRALVLLFVSTLVLNKLGLTEGIGPLLAGSVVYALGRGGSVVKQSLMMFVCINGFLLFGLETPFSTLSYGALIGLGVAGLEKAISADFSQLVIAAKRRIHTDPRLRDRAIFKTSTRRREAV
jgi:hypothetical protein